MIFNWNDDKNARLKRERHIGFEEIIIAIENGQLLDILVHPDINKYKNQKLYVVAMENYVYIVPFKEDKDEIYLITIFPSRKYTKKYFGRERNNS